MIWVAVLNLCITAVLYKFLYQRDRKSMGINAFFASMTLLMAMVFSEHWWQRIYPLAVWHGVFVPMSHWMFNIF